MNSRSSHKKTQNVRKDAVRWSGGKKYEAWNIWALPDKYGLLLWERKTGAVTAKICLQKPVYRLQTKKDLFSTSGWVTKWVWWGQKQSVSTQVTSQVSESSIMSWDSTSNSTGIKYIHEDILQTKREQGQQKAEHHHVKWLKPRGKTQISVNGLKYRVRWGRGANNGSCIDAFTDVQQLDSVYTERQRPHRLLSLILNTGY